MDKNLNYIIIEGAQSTGKTTLINQLKQVYPHIPQIAQVARSVIRHQKIINEQLQTNQNNCFQDLQYKILLAQHQSQAQHQANHNNTPCILDRCVISPLVYSLYYFKQNPQLISKIENSEQFKESLQSYKQSSLVFLIIPHKQILKDDGVRKLATFQELKQITVLYKQVMEKNEIKYVQIDQLSQRDKKVAEVIQKFNIK